MVLHQVKHWQNWKMQGCFMQFLRLIFVKKLQLQGAKPPDPHQGCCPLDPHWGPSATPRPQFSADFSILNSHAWYWQGQTDSVCCPFGGEGWKRELISNHTPSSTLCASHIHLIWLCCFVLFISLGSIVFSLTWNMHVFILFSVI